MTVGALVLAMLRFSPGHGALATRLAPVILEEAQAQGVDPVLVAAVAAYESDYKQQTVGARGEVGVMQIAPTGRATRWCRRELPRLGQVRANVRCGAKLLRHALEVCGGDQVHALSHYNGWPCISSRYARGVLRKTGWRPNQLAEGGSPP